MEYNNATTGSARKNKRNNQNVRFVCYWVRGFFKKSSKSLKPSQYLNSLCSIYCDNEVKKEHYRALSAEHTRKTRYFTYVTISSHSCWDSLPFSAGYEGHHAVSHYRADGSDSSGEDVDPSSVSPEVLGLPAHLPSFSAAWWAESQSDQTGVSWNSLSGPHCDPAHSGSAQWRLCRLVSVWSLLLSWYLSCVLLNWFYWLFNML